jgi:hypothetical protein
MFERIRSIMELVGVSGVVITLLFVGFELKQTREMNLAQLHFNRMEMFHSKMLAVLESEPALNAMAKRSASGGSTEDLTEIEKTTLHVRAHAQIAEWEADYRYVEQGFATRSLNDLKNEISYSVALTPEIKNAWAEWDMPGLESYSFTAMMNEVLDRSEQPSD